MAILGAKILMTGIVVFLFFVVLFAIGKAEPQTPGYQWFGLVALLGLVAMPVGALMLIWGLP